MDQLPVTWAALGILFRLGWVIERKLDVMEGAQILVFQNGNTVTVGSDGELHRPSSQVSQYSLVVRVHSVLARSQIHGMNRKAFHDGLHLIQGEPVGASGIAVAEGALEVALVGEPKPERNAGIGMEGHHFVMVDECSGLTLLIRLLRSSVA
jgi:hypothetical protein